MTLVDLLGANHLLHYKSEVPHFSIRGEVMRERLRLIAFLLAVVVANVGLISVTTADARVLSACSGDCGCDRNSDCGTGCACFPNPVCAATPEKGGTCNAPE